MPAAVLILVLLGAIAVDASIAFLAHREALNAASAAANDAAGAALDEKALVDDDEIVLDERRVRAAAEAAVRGQSSSVVNIDLARSGVEIDDLTVTVRVVGSAGYVFARAVPGAPETVDVEATASAELRQGL